MNFIYTTDGMKEEYEKIKSNEIFLLRLNGGDKKAIKTRLNDLERRKNKLFDQMRNEMISITLSEKALAEIGENL